MTDEDVISNDDRDLVDLIQEEGLTSETEEIIQENAEELMDDIDSFDDDVQMKILENL